MHGRSDGNNGPLDDVDGRGGVWNCVAFAKVRELWGSRAADFLVQVLLLDHAVVSIVILDLDLVLDLTVLLVVTCGDI